MEAVKETTKLNEVESKEGDRHKPLHKKPVKENPNQSAKRLLKEDIDKLKVFALQQTTYNQIMNSNLMKAKTLVDILAMRLVSGEIVEAALPKEALAKLESDYIIEAGAAGTYAIHKDTLEISTFKSCLENWKNIGKEETTSEDSNIKKFKYTFQKTEGIEATIDIIAHNDPEAYSLLRNAVLGL